MSVLRMITDLLGELLGYLDYYRDEEATCIVTGGAMLRTSPCVNICMKKSLSSKSAGTVGGSVFSQILNIFSKK